MDIDPPVVLRVLSQTAATFVTSSVSIWEAMSGIDLLSHSHSKTRLFDVKDIILLSFISLFPVSSTQTLETHQSYAETDDGQRYGRFAAIYLPLFYLGVIFVPTITCCYLT